MTFQQKLDRIVKKNNSLLCVGLDSDFEKIPKHLKKLKDPIFAFNKAIIEATSDLVCAYKLNSAFYEACGIKGIKALVKTIKYLRKNYPGIVVILDGKRSDIGNTNLGYVVFAFDWLRVDGVTVYPYMGREAMEPFLERKDKGIIIICRTSNPGAGEFQDLKIGGEPLYKIIAKKVKNNWNKNGNCLLVVGATYPRELAEIRKIVGEMTLLIPGVGAQGGDVVKTVLAGQNSKGEGMIINSSRAIIFASNERNFAQAAKIEAKKTCDLIDTFRKMGAK